MEDMNVTKARCSKQSSNSSRSATRWKSLERASRKSWRNKKKKTSHRPKQLIFNTETTASREPYPGRPLFYQSKARKTRG